MMCMDSQRNCYFTITQHAYTIAQFADHASLQQQVGGNHGSGANLSNCPTLTTAYTLRKMPIFMAFLLMPFSLRIRR